jgi:hypothetical protein
MRKILSIVVILSALGASAQANSISGVVHGVKAGIAAYTTIHGMLVQVPEPSTFAIAALGATTVLFVLRRSK